MYICSVIINITDMADVLFLIGFFVTLIWFCRSKYTPVTIWGFAVFVVSSMIFTPVITIPVQWAYAKYIR